MAVAAVAAVVVGWGWVRRGGMTGFGGLLVGCGPGNCLSATPTLRASASKLPQGKSDAVHTKGPQRKQVSASGMRVSGMQMPPNWYDMAPAGVKPPCRAKAGVKPPCESF